jgi:hypothetical protein
MKMIDGELVLKKLHQYVINVLRRREKYGEDSLVESLYSTEVSALEIHTHGVNTLGKYLNYGFEPPEEASDPYNFKEDSSNTLTNQLIEAYDDLMKKFNENMQIISESQLQKHLDLICTLVMHTIVHAGQALRLQAVYLRQKK